MNKWNGLYHNTPEGPKKCYAQTPDACRMEGSTIHGTSKEEVNEVVKSQEKANGNLLAQEKPKPLFSQKSVDRNKKIQELEQRLEETIGFKNKRPIKKEIAKLKYEAEGLTYEEGIERDNKLKEEKENKYKRQQEESNLNSQKLSQMDYIPIPENFDKHRNAIIDKPLHRHKVTAYRGEKVVGAKENTGTAMYGQGIYTTQDRKYASNFGNVRRVSPDEMPAVPLRLKSQEDYHQLEYEVCKQYNIEKRDLYNHFEPQDLIKKMGFDGLTIGKDNQVIVKY